MRPAVLEAAGDVAALALLRRAQASTDRRLPSGDDFGRRFAAWVRAQGGHRTFWLAESTEGGAAGRRATGVRLPVGMVGLLRYERMPSPGEEPSAWGYLGNLFVLPDHRRRGTGTALLEAATDFARETGMVRLVLAPNQRTAPLCRRMGFRDARELMVHPLDPDDAYAGDDLDDLVHPMDLHPLD